MDQSAMEHFISNFPRLASLEVVSCEAAGPAQVVHGLTGHPTLQNSIEQLVVRATDKGSRRSDLYGDVGSWANFKKLKKLSISASIMLPSCPTSNPEPVMIHRFLTELPPHLECFTLLDSYPSITWPYIENILEPSPKNTTRAEAFDSHNHALWM